MNNWFQRCYTRLLIDNHISEDDALFMTRFDPQRYVALVKKAGIEASMVYACCHNGNCYYPTQVGHMHHNLNERDIFGEKEGARLCQPGWHADCHRADIHNEAGRNDNR